MVCSRCITAVQQVFERNGVIPEDIALGEIITSGDITKKQLSAISHELSAIGFEILDDRQSRMIEKIKILLIEKVQSENIQEHFSLSEFLTASFHKDYSTLSRTFSDVEGITIEQFFILQKIEKVKELLAYNELTLSEIAWKLGYSSVQHLSAQFKKVTGLTPTHIKKHSDKQRKSLDNVK